MAYADYEICPGCAGKAVYVGDGDFPDEVTAWHESCLGHHVAAAVAAERERIEGLFGQWVGVIMQEPNSWPPEAWRAGFADLIRQGDVTWEGTGG